MTKRVTQLAALPALALAMAATAFADIKINDNFAVGGYAVGEANYNQSKPTTGNTTSTSKLDGDAYKLWSNVTFAPVTGTISLYAGQAGDPVILDAFATYDAGGGTKITVGKFLSWMGYESFDPINMATITYGWQTPQGYSLANIPAYHSGVKVETGNDAYTVGVAVLDSVDPMPVAAPPIKGSKLGIEKGDGDLKNGPGFEAYATYKGVKDLTLFAGLTYEHNTGVNGANTGDYSFDATFSSVDLWAQYVLGDTTIAGEYSYRLNDLKHGLYNVGTTFALVEVQQAINKQWTVTGRVSWVSAQDKTPVPLTKPPTPTNDPNATTLTIAPAYTLTANLSVVVEYSYTKYSNSLLNMKSGNFVAAQARFKF
jgi:hypothetical protein